MKFTTSALVAALCGAMATTVSAQAKFNYGTPNPNAIGVKARNPNGPTNPAAPSLGTPINQTSYARLASINSVDDWCTFSSPDGQNISDVEEITVAYCTKARNNARVIPDGTLTAVHFVKTPLYVQIMALGDFTKIGMQAGDEGGELDPHGATNMGNPIGGNVTSNITGTDVFYEEWMNYISYNMVCFRVCIAGTDIAPTPLECQHTLDEMGCNYVMPGNYADNVFDTCEGDAAYPPGLYPEGNGETSTFQQYYSMNGFVNGSPDEITPQAAFSTPATSSCVTQSTIANGITGLIASTSSSTSSSSSATKSLSKSSVAQSTGSTASSSTSGSSSSGSTTGAATSGASISSLPVLIFVGVASMVMAAILL